VRANGIANTSLLPVHTVLLNSPADVSGRWLSLSFSNEQEKDNGTQWVWVGTSKTGQNSAGPVTRMGMGDNVVGVLIVALAYKY
jgi:hypothetical protein